MGMLLQGERALLAIYSTIQSILNIPPLKKKKEKILHENYDGNAFQPRVSKVLN